MPKTILYRNEFSYSCKKNSKYKENIPMLAANTGNFSLVAIYENLLEM